MSSRAGSRSASDAFPSSRPSRCRRATRCSSSGSPTRSTAQARCPSPGSCTARCTSWSRATTSRQPPDRAGRAISSRPRRATRSSAGRSRGSSRRSGSVSGARGDSSSGSMARARARSRRESWMASAGLGRSCCRPFATRRSTSPARASRRSRRGSGRRASSRTSSPGTAGRHQGPCLPTSSSTRCRCTSSRGTPRASGNVSSPSTLRRQIRRTRSRSSSGRRPRPPSARGSQPRASSSSRASAPRSASIWTPWLERAADPLERGLVLLIDYGASAAELYAPDRGSTLRAYHRHRVHADALVAIGRQDLTAHVDLTAVERAAAAAGLSLLGRTRQAKLLAALGIGDLLVGLQSNLGTTLEAYLEAKSAVVRMLDPRATGAFAVLAFGRGLAGEPPLRGFAPRT